MPPESGLGHFSFIQLYVYPIAKECICIASSYRQIILYFWGGSGMNGVVSNSIYMEQTTVDNNTKATPPLSQARYVLYARKSTESDEKQALSIDSQVKEMLAIAERDNLNVVDVRRESHSAKDSSKRPIFNEIIEDIKRERFNAILTWAPDRLSRNAGDLGTLVDLMDQGLLLDIQTYNQHFTNSPNEKFLLMILCSQAKLENDNKSINVKRGLKMRCEMGLWPAPAPTGYLNEKRIDRKGHVLVDTQRAPIIKQMFEKVAYEKWSGKKLYHWLKFDLNFRTATGNKNLSLSNIYLILQNPFYYGSFEYPKNSGRWYKGKHIPLVSKDLFDDVQEQMRAQYTRTEGKEFAFTKLMKCGLCGSGITAEEKFKKLKDGSTKRYVYYKCTKSKDKDCKCGCIEESALINKLEGLVDVIEIDEIKIKDKLFLEAKRLKKIYKIISGDLEEIKIDNIDIRNYAKYILREGLGSEKRDLILSIDNYIYVSNKTVSLSRY